MSNSSEEISEAAENLRQNWTRTTGAWGALAALSLAMLLPSLGVSAANVALPTLAQTFAASFAGVQWVVLAYLLAITTLIVSVGRLGDLMGRRRLMLAGVVLFTVAATLAGLAPNLGILIVARGVQGLGAAILMALSMALAGETVAKTKTGSVMGLLGAMSAIGTALGPSLGGVLIAGFGWRALFLINLLLGVVTLFLAYRFLPGDVPRRTASFGQFDKRGTLLLALTLGAYALALTLGRGRFGIVNLALLLIAALGLGLFVRTEARAAVPLLRLGLFRDPGLCAGLTMNLLVATIMMATLVVGPFYLSQAFALNAAQVGAVMSVGPIVAALAGVPAGWLVDRFGAQRIIIPSLIGVSVGAATLTLMPAAAGIPGYLVAVALMTASYALFQAANNTSVMTGVEPDRRGVVAGVLNLSRNLGLITGASGLGAVFAFATGTGDLTTATPGAVTVGLRATFTVAALLGGSALALAVITHTFQRRAKTSTAPTEACACR